MTEVIFLSLGLGLMAISVIAILLAGIRNVTLGKSDFKKMSVMLIPFVIFAIAYGITGSAAQGGILTMIILMAAMVLSIAFTGLRGTFKL